MKENIKKLLDSDLSSVSIAQQTQVDVSVISRVRNGERALGKITLDTAEKLNEYSIIYKHKDIEKINSLRLKMININEALNEYIFSVEEESELLETKKNIETQLKELLEK